MMGVYEPKPHKVTVEQAVSAASEVLTVNPRIAGKTAVENVANTLLKAFEHQGWDLPAQVFGIVTTDAQGTRVPADAPGGVLSLVPIPDPEEFADDVPDSVFHRLACRDLSDFDGLSVVTEGLMSDAGKIRESRQVLTLLNRQASGTVRMRGRPLSAATHTAEIGGPLPGFMATALYGPPPARLPLESEREWIIEVFARAEWLGQQAPLPEWTVDELIATNSSQDLALATQKAEKVLADAGPTCMAQCVDGVRREHDILINDAMLAWVGGRLGLELVFDFNWDPDYTRAMRLPLRLAEVANPTTPAAVALSKSVDALAQEMTRLRAGDRLREMSPDLVKQARGGQLSAQGLREYDRLSSLKSVTTRRVFVFALLESDPILRVDMAMDTLRGLYGKSAKKYTRDVARAWNLYLQQVHANEIPESQWQPIVRYVRHLLEQPLKV